MMRSIALYLKFLRNPKMITRTSQRNLSINKKRLFGIDSKQQWHTVHIFRVLLFVRSFAWSVMLTLVIQRGLMGHRFEIWSTELNFNGEMRRAEDRIKICHSARKRANQQNNLFKSVCNIATKRRRNGIKHTNKISSGRAIFMFQNISTSAACEESTPR